MKKKILIMTLALVLVLVFAVPSFGKSVSQSITVAYDNIKISVHGRQITPAAEPFIYNGTTYLPVRAVAEALGENVEWDRTTKTVRIGESTTALQGVSINSLNIMSASYYGYEDDGTLKTGDVNDETVTPWNSRLIDNTGAPHQNGIIIESYINYTRDLDDTTEVTYALNGSYSGFKGTIVIPDADKSDEYVDHIVQIYGDDELLFESDRIVPGTMPQNFDTDVDGVLKLTIKTVYKGESHPISSARPHIAIVDATFTK